MKKIIEFSVGNKFALWLFTIILTIAGIYAGTTMKLETLPNITTPTVSVTTVYPGATPEQVLNDVSTEIEEKLENLEGVESVRSSSFQNASNVQVDYSFNTDMDKATQKVEETLSKVEFPEGVQDPQVSRISFDAFPVVGYAVSDKNLELSELTKLVEKDLQPKLEGIEGAQTVQIAGQEINVVEIVFNEDKLKKYNLKEDDVKKIIQANDTRLALGLYEFENKEQAVVLNGKAKTIQDLKDLKITYVPAAQPGAAQPGAAPAAQPGAAPAAQPGAASATQPESAAAAQIKKLPTVNLSEVASVKYKGVEESISRTNGERSIGIQVTKSQDANTVDVVNDVKKEIKDFEKENDGAKASLTLDQGEPIEESVSTMISKAITGAAFAILIILVFLRNVRSTIISVISIPLSLLMALIVLKQLDISLNTMTLGAMTVAIGRVVDDSIVVIENIYRRLTSKEEKLKGKELIISATREMFVPIASSTVVTIAVFLPLGLVSGFVGELFLPFALTMVFALIASLIVAVTIVPMMADSLFKDNKKLKPEKENGWMSSKYKKILEWSLNKKKTVFGLATLLLLASFALVPVIGVNFLNQGAEKTLYVTYNPEPGQTLEDSLEAAEKAEGFFMDDQKNVKDVQFTVGGENPMSPGNNKQAVFIVQYDEETEEFEDLKAENVKELNEIAPNGEWKEQSFGGPAGGGAEYNVYAKSIEELEEVTPKFISEIEKEEKYVRKVTSNLKESYMEYTFNVDQKKAAEFGVSTAQLAQSIAQVQGEEQPISSLKIEGKEIDVIVPNKKTVYDSIEDLQDKKVITPLGTKDLSEFVSLEKGTTPDTLVQSNGKLLSTISVELKTDKVTEASAAIEDRVKDLELPSGVTYSTGGVTEQITESFTQLGIAIAAAVAIVYLVLVITFGGASTPLVILFSLPYAIIGGLVALWISGETISVSSLIGALMLIGIVVTNAIVLIDRVIHKEKEGMSTREALLEAAGTRLRPILMTALATIGALAPLALGLEGGALISKGLGVTVIGGLVSSTLLTLLIVPIVYEFFAKFKKKKQPLK